MAAVQVEVNGRPFTVGCEDGQEAHVQALARQFDAQVREVGQDMGQLGEVRLFLMAALLTADELGDVRARLAQAQAELGRLQSDQARAEARPTPQEAGSTAIEARAALALDGAARRIEALTRSLTGSPAPQPG